MRKVALLTCLAVAAALVIGGAGVATAALVDSGSALVVVVVMTLGTLVIAGLEWAHRRSIRVGQTSQSAHLRPSTRTERVGERDALSALDDLRAARDHHAHAAHPT